jgi:hypothetical protein
MSTLWSQNIDFVVVFLQPAKDYTFSRVNAQ